MFELILFLIGAVIASAILERFIPMVSLPLVQIALGFGIALFVSTELNSGLDAELLLILFIAPLHFNESRHVDSGKLWDNRKAIASMAMGLVFVIMLTAGATLHAILPAIPLAACFAFGAAMGSTDAVAVNGATKDYRFSKRHDAILKGEALFNDVTGTVAFKCCVAVLLSGSFSVLHAGEEFALDLFGGLIGGAIMGAIAWFLLEFIKWRGVDSPTIHVALELLAPFVVYLVAKHLHIGAIIAVVGAGLVMSVMPQRRSAVTARQKLQSKGVWDTLEFILNGAIFVILGMQLPRLLRPLVEGSVQGWVTIGAVIAITVVLEAVRFLWVVGLDAAHAKGEHASVRACFERVRLRESLAMAFAGPKGGITLSLLLTIASNRGSFSFDDRLLLISVASGVILLTIVLANFAVPALVPTKTNAKRTRERADREIVLTIAVIDSIEADAHLTGMVKADAPEEGVDEPATVIVMKRYADALVDLASGASPELASRARQRAAHVDELYAKLGDVGRAVVDAMDEDVEDDALLGEGIRALRAVSDAIEDVQAQALARELQLIRAMHEEGGLDAAHAKELRNDVYIQQLTFD